MYTDVCSIGKPGPPFVGASCGCAELPLEILVCITAIEVSSVHAVGEKYVFVGTVSPIVDGDRGHPHVQSTSGVFHQLEIHGVISWGERCLVRPVAEVIC